LILASFSLSHCQTPPPNASDIVGKSGSGSEITASIKLIHCLVTAVVRGACYSINGNSHLFVKCVGCGVHMCRLKMSDVTKNRQNDAAEIRKIDPIVFVAARDE
jgi:hypothetical protein